MSAGRTVGSAATSTGIVHLGAGAFARGHPWWCTAIAVDAEPGPWGVVAVAQRSSRVVDALRSRGWGYDVDLRDEHGSELFHVDLISDGLVADEEPERLREALAAPETLVVTVTATEAGYRPGSKVAGQLVATAEVRARRSAPPLTVVVCDNVQDGAGVLRGLVLDTARARGLEDVAAAIEATWAFPSSVVDRVVPVVPEERQPDVRAEPFFRWVLEDRFAGPVPAWGAAGVRLVADTAPWQLAKLTLVNAPHSLLAYLGLAQGHRSVDQAVTDPFVRAAVEEALGSELVPCVPHAEGLDPAEDARESLRRFANPAITHPLAQVGSGGSDKLRERLRAPVDRARAGAGTARWSALAVAGWARAIGAGQAEDPRADEVRRALEAADPAAALLDVAGLGAEQADDPVADELRRWWELIETRGLVRALTA